MIKHLVLLSLLLCLLAVTAHSQRKAWLQFTIGDSRDTVVVTCTGGNVNYRDMQYTVLRDCKLTAGYEWDEAITILVREAYANKKGCAK